MKTQLSKPARSHARYTEEYKKEIDPKRIAQFGLVAEDVESGQF
jgi:hypothetical protein